MEQRPGDHQNQQSSSNSQPNPQEQQTNIINITTENIQEQKEPNQQQNQSGSTSVKNAFCRVTKVVDLKQKVGLHKHLEIVTQNQSRSSWLGWFGRHHKFHYHFWTCARLFEDLFRNLGKNEDSSFAIR